jgi:hypothetical protein
MLIGIIKLLLILKAVFVLFVNCPKPSIAKVVVVNGD